MFENGARCWRDVLAPFVLSSNSQDQTMKPFVSYKISTSAFHCLHRWWKMCHLRFLRSTVYISSHLWWMQLWKFWRAMCGMWWSGCDRCVLLSRMRPDGKRSRWMSQNCEFRIDENRFILRTEKIWIQKAVTRHGLFCFMCMCIYWYGNKRLERLLGVLRVSLVGDFIVLNWGYSQIMKQVQITGWRDSLTPAYVTLLKI